MMLAASRLLASDKEAENPVTLSDLRLVATTDAEFSRCTSGQVSEQCWTCRDHICGHTERLAYGGWSVSSSAFVSTDSESLDCEVAAQSIRISFNYLHDPSQITIQVPGRKNIILHEARPVHLYLDGVRFTNPADGPYLKMEFRADDGSIADRHKLIDQMQSAYQITVEGWNIDDKKVSTVDLGEGLASAVRYCQQFAAGALGGRE
jgi:hypothetical protein